MSTEIHESTSVKSDRGLAHIIILHEASRNPELHKELPNYLAQAVGASAVVVAFIDLDEQGRQTSRQIHSSRHFGLSSTAAEDDWVESLLHESTKGGGLVEAIRIVPGSLIRALFPIDANAAVAFQIESPAAVHIITEDGRSLVTHLLRHIANVLKQQSRRTHSKVRTKPLLRTLTKAEWRVLMALDSDMPEKQIADELGTTANTLHSHIKSIYRRLGVQSRLSAITLLRRAERETLIEELQTPRGVESRVSGFDPSHNGSLEPSSHPGIPGLTLSEPRNLSVA